jgi:hypothetical protein
MSELEQLFTEYKYIFEDLRKYNLYIYTYRDDYSFNENICIEFKSKYINKKYKTLNQIPIENYNYLCNINLSSSKFFANFIERILAMLEIEIIQDIQKTNRTFIFDSELPFKIWKNYIEKLSNHH